MENANKSVINTELALNRSQKRLRKLREEKGYTKDKVAKDNDISPTSISNWENGIKTPSYINYLTLSDYYGVSFEYISGIEPREIRHKENSDMCERTHLSEQAIENILYECSEKGNNQRIFMLNLILSNKEIFNSLMDSLCALFYPPSLGIDLKNIPNVFLDKVNKDVLIISMDHLSQILVTPEEHYQHMKNRIEQLKKTAPENIIAPNEFDNWDLSDLVDEDEEE